MYIFRLLKAHFTLCASVFPLIEKCNAKAACHFKGSTFVRVGAESLRSAPIGLRRQKSDVIVARVQLACSVNIGANFVFDGSRGLGL